MEGAHGKTGMESFISQIAGVLYEQYGDDVSSLNVLFPSRRARLFFGQALSRIADKPLWQPTYTTVDDIMSEVSGLKPADHIRLVAELYKVYSEFHDETFDEFYFWGEMLLSDFDSIDKYMIDARMLFSNLTDLKAMEADLSYLTDEQRKVIAQFWQSLGDEADYSDEQRRFVGIWRTLWPVYQRFREQLAAEGLAYGGMMYRAAAEKIKAEGYDLPKNEKGEPSRYVIAGFNALSDSEKVLFDFLSATGHVDFFWDYDHYYFDDPLQEAGLFLRENVVRYPQRLSLPYDSNGFSRPKQITVVSAPSDTMQCKYAGDFLLQLMEREGKAPDKETAVILTDEELLIPVLHSIPPQVDDINVTMGYPLKLTSAYSLVERLLGLQLRRRGKGGAVQYYHSDVTGLLRHPFVAGSAGRQAREAADAIVARGRVYVDPRRLDLHDEFLTAVFRPLDEGWEAVSDYLIDILAHSVTAGAGAADSRPDDDMRVEMLGLIADNVRKLRASLENVGVEVSVRIYAALLRKVLQAVAVPYEGEPLRGVQVMGILETRNLDFRNIVMLSLGDDTFPGSRVSSSFVPYNLRVAYGLPTPAHHEGVYAYYFYRLLQRAENISLVYSSRSDERSSGEPSRYLYQLEYESRHEIQKLSIGLDAGLAVQEPVVIEKDSGVAAALERFCGDDPVKLSSTALSNYITCPLKFYFYSVARLAPEKEISEEVDAPVFGTILHAAAEKLYQPAIGMEHPQEYLRELIGTPAVEAAVAEAIAEEYPSGGAADDEYGGDLLLVRDIIIRYLNTCLLPYDAAQEGFRVDKLEQYLLAPVEFDAGGEQKNVVVGGVADRIDRLADGTMRVVDYKTGVDKLKFNGVESLFGEAPEKQNPAVFQTMLYSMALNRETGRDVQPALYFIRQLNADGYSPLPDDKTGGRVTSYLRYKEPFEQGLRSLLTSIFDLSQPFRQCSDAKPCQWCDFNVICRRK